MVFDNRRETYLFVPVYGRELDIGKYHTRVRIWWEEIEIMFRCKMANPSR